MMMDKQKRIFSGIRATGNLHLGNYMGAIKGMLEIQADPDYEMLFSVVDIHAMTTPYDKDSLAVKTRSVVLDYLASGLDPEQSTLIVQSKVIDLHAELMFYFSTVTTMARMQHLPTFKEKIRQHPDNVTMALLNYPVLMAADILIYHGSLVPVGIDQMPHIEVAREIARKMNAYYGTDFPQPDRFATTGEYVPSLSGEGKMSKSVEGSFINLTDSIDEIYSKLKRVPTDGGKGKIKTQKSKLKKDEISFMCDGNESHGVHSLYSFVGLFMGEEKQKEMVEQYQSSGIRYGDLKKELADAIFAEIKPIQEKRSELEKDTAYVDRVIQQGAEKARVIAGETVRDVKKKMGLM